ncbi:drug/metabolite transporter (DMT)-like permease [Neisseria sp. HSC-16F19]|nr:multidrug resistance efflux transporter family protein [Neisseria sp. HSC-16F19]MCP2041239.1 drug/metabolite transporter (DMT)-like permease [Neisseria sp. HSC-16F19]
MLKMLACGLLGAAFFSTSFVLYELMSVQGGHWFWSASLRCLFMLLLSLLLIVLQEQGRSRGLRQVLGLWRQQPLFWCLSGSIGLGAYGWLAFSADHAPAWVITSTYLFTVVASLLVLALFGQRFRPRVLLYACIIFAGIVLANWGESRARAPAEMQNLWLLGALPALLAAFCFPIGNQLVWQAGHGNPAGLSGWRQKLLGRLPQIPADKLGNPLHKVCLLSAGSLPLWLLLGLAVQPPPPSAAQAGMALLVALSAGVIGTAVFLYARSLATTPGQVAAVDATQATEIIFALIGGIILLATPLPSLVSTVGMMMIIGGLLLFARHT